MLDDSAVARAIVAAILMAGEDVAHATCAGTGVQDMHPHASPDRCLELADYLISGGKDNA